MRLIRLLFLLTFAAAPSLFGAACAPALLSVYDAPLFTCQMGSFTLKDVTYSLISGTVTIADTDITVTPSPSSDTLGLKFSSPKFSVSGSDSAKYLLTYFWDPGDIRWLVDVLDDPVTPPGLARIATAFCFNGEFGVACPPATGTVTVFDDGISPHPVASSGPLSGACSPVCTFGVQNTIELDSNSGGSASFSDFFNKTMVNPEPGTWTGGLLGLALLLRFRRRHSRSIE
jgi:MYXO-CTERM domain-containing protein